MGWPSCEPNNTITSNREFHEQMGEQNTSLKRVEDHLEMVREATDRNTLEQQELLEDLKAVGNKVNLVAIIALGLLGVSVLLNLFPLPFIFSAFFHKTGGNSGC